MDQKPLTPRNLIELDELIKSHDLDWGYIISESKNIGINCYVYLILMTLKNRFYAKIPQNIINSFKKGSRFKSWLLLQFNKDKDLEKFDEWDRWNAFLLDYRFLDLNKYKGMVFPSKYTIKEMLKIKKVKPKEYLKNVKHIFWRTYIKILLLFYLKYQKCNSGNK